MEQEKWIASKAKIDGTQLDGCCDGSRETRFDESLKEEVSKG